MRDFSTKLPRGIRRLFRLPSTPRREQRETDDEISFHFEMRVTELRSFGMSEAEARAEAARRFGDPQEYRAYEARRTAINLRWYGPKAWAERAERILIDARLTLRGLRRDAIFSGAVILILGLGIGMTTATFTVFQSVLLHAMPIPEQNRVVELSGRAEGAATEVSIVPAQLRRFRAETRMLSSVAAFGHWRVLRANLTDGDRTISLKEAQVTGNFFDVLNVRPALGRVFHPDEVVDFEWSAPKRTYPVVLSYGAWLRAFGGDSAVLGRHLHEPKTDMNVVVVGVAPPGLDYPQGVECWIGYLYGSLDVVGRLAPGATVASARDEFFQFLDRDPDVVSWSGSHSLRAQVHTLEQMVVGDARPVLVILAAAVGLLMLIACTNVGNLMLLRAAGRMREMAIRRAIGASIGDLVRHLIVECVLLAVAAGLVGIVCARLFVAALVSLAPAGLPRLDLVAVAGWPLAIAASVTLLTVIVFGLVPSLGALRFDLSSPLRAGGRLGTASRGVVQLRTVLVTAQIALAVIVAAGAGLLIRSLERLTTLNTGYSTEHLSFLNVSFPWVKMIADCQPHRATLTAADSARWERCEEVSNYNAHDRVMAQLRSLPQVVSVSPSVAPPFLGSNVWMAKIVREHESEAEEKASPWFGLDLVGAEFFRTLDMPILRGRGFTDADREGTPKVAVISEGVAHVMWPHEDPLGQRFYQSSQNRDSLITVIGLVPDLHFREYRQATPTVFRPYRQVLAQGYFVVRTRGAPEQSFRAMLEATVDAGVGATLINAQSMDQLIAPQLAAPRFQTLLLALFAGAALLLAAVGLYGLTAAAVNQQTRELGIRIALGATPRNLRHMVLGRTVALAGAGACAGLIVAAGASRLMRSMLFEVSPIDPLTLLAVAVLLFTVALVAAYVPARRATLIDPARALRAD
ncbi:MAG TPA: ADOP family duplicated permease [Gemmatimonadaceae bacterium]|nr:ADOP family duplicated permease [Gemmatimonadaceae bacterium]